MYQCKNITCEFESFSVQKLRQQKVNNDNISNSIQFHKSTTPQSQVIAKDGKDFKDRVISWTEVPCNVRAQQSPDQILLWWRSSMMLSVCVFVFERRSVCMRMAWYMDDNTN